MNVDVVSNVLAFVRDMLIIGAATALAWHHQDAATLSAAFGVYGMLLGASTTTRGTRLGVQAALTMPPGTNTPSQRPPPS